MKTKSKKGSVLVLTLIGVVIGAAIIGSIMRYVAVDSALVEKEIGHAKAAEILKGATILYNTSVANETNLSNSQLDTLKQLIGGGGNSQPIFGKSESGINSTIPGFYEYLINWLESSSTTSPSLVEPTNPNGFWYFPGTYTAKVKAIHTGSTVPAVREGSRAIITSSNQMQIVPVFSMLSFYDKDFEIAAHYESAQCIGHIHSNGSIYLDCRSSGPDRISFHGLQDYPILSANDTVYRRGRNGATSYYKFGSTANAGLDFWIYNEANFNTIINTNDLNYSNNTTRIFTRDLTPDYTSWEEGAINTDTSQEPVRRRFAGGSIGDDYGYVFTGTSLVTGETFDASSTDGGTVSAIQFGTAVSELTPPVAINPYQYIEDIQYEDTPDTIDYSSPTASNYKEDSDRNEQISQLAFNSIAPLVIRDGVAYYRTSIGGDLTPVVDLLVSNNNSSTFYPDDTHATARRYGDLRWYGWFGMNDGVLPTPDNPARWHFPLKSITFNATKDQKNAGDASTSSEGTAVAFTFRNSTIHNPLEDGIRDKNGNPVTATWIKTTYDLNGFSGYPGSNTNPPSDDATGEGVGMYYVSYPTIGDEGYEKYDPVRVAYNIVKGKVRQFYNAHHIYTSRHNGTKMLNIDGSAPVDGTTPDIWGSGITASSFGDGTDFDNFDNDNNDNTGVNFSAFWNDDGALIEGGYRYLRIFMYENDGHGNFLRISELSWVCNGVDYPKEKMTGTSTPAPYQVSHSTAQNVSDAGWYAYDDNTNGRWTSQVNQNTNQWIEIDCGADSANWISPDQVKLRAHSGASSPAMMPKRFKFEASHTGAFSGEEILLGYFENETGWTKSEERTYNLNGTGVVGGGPFEKLYAYRRDQATANTEAKSGELLISDEDDTTPRVEIFPIRHSSLTDTSSSPTALTDWFIYKSTLPLCNRTLKMPVNRNNLNGWDYSTNLPLAADRTTNFGYAGTPQGNHNWMVLLNNAPEMLARQNDGLSGITFETPTDDAGLGADGLGFYYYGGDVGGFYGNDNLCMIDGQEKKIVVFTEIDLSELTKECLAFNGLTNAWSFDFNSNTASVSSEDELQNLIYAVNTTMGINFYGNRVHCGAIRIKRGRLITHPLAVATPNALHVYGDLNCPGYWHHGKRRGENNVSYNVPNFREHNPSEVYRPQPLGLYADSIHAYENSWIKFNMSNTNNDSIRDQYFGTFQSSLSAGTGDSQERIFFDHKLWWEDDGMRRRGICPGNNPNISQLGAQLFTNYHETIFNHDDNDYYTTPSAYLRGRTPNRAESSQIWKHIPQGINAGLLYGNVESKLPSYFYNVDVANIPIAKPASIDELDWYISWIPRNRWIEFERNQMRNDFPDTLTNGGFDIGSLSPAGTYYNPGYKLEPSNYFGTDFANTGNWEWEDCKLKFSGGGYMYDVRFHTNHTHNLAEWTSNRQTYGRNIRGAFACLFDSRQSTHGWNQTMMGMENQQIFYSYNMDFNDAANLPPGTPMTTIIPEVNYTIEGTKWEY